MVFYHLALIGANLVKVVINLLLSILNKWLRVYKDKNQPNFLYRINESRLQSSIVMRVPIVSPSGKNYCEQEPSHFSTVERRGEMTIVKNNFAPDANYSIWLAAVILLIQKDPLSLSLKHPSLKIGDKLSELRLLADNNIIFRSMSIISTTETLASRSFQQNWFSKLISHAISMYVKSNMFLRLYGEFWKSLLMLWRWASIVGQQSYGYI